eukprot:SAG25_NODE_1471_length_2949_cov_4.091228_5_plen_80_part_00
MQSTGLSRQQHRTAAAPPPPTRRPRREGSTRPRGQPRGGGWSAEPAAGVIPMMGPLAPRPGHRRAPAAADVLTCRTAPW